MVKCQTRKALWEEDTKRRSSRYRFSSSTPDDTANELEPVFTIPNMIIVNKIEDLTLHEDYQI